MSDHDMSNVPPDFIAPTKIPERDMQQLAEMEARLTAMHNPAAPQPVAVVSDVYQSRYTIEWIGGSMPAGTVLFAVVAEAGHVVAMSEPEAKAGADYIHVGALTKDLFEWLNSRELVPEINEDGTFSVDGLIQMLDTHEDELMRSAQPKPAEGERDEALRDAERYRWLRDKANFAKRVAPQVCMFDCLTGNAEALHAEQVDAAIDSAMGDDKP